MLSELPPDAQRTILEFLAHSVRFIHALAPSKWGLTRYRVGLRLNAGFSEVLTAYSDEVFVLVLETDLPPHLDEHVSVVRRYPSAPGSALIRVPIHGTAPLDELLAALRQPHEQILRVAAQRGFNLGSKNGHEPAAVEELAQIVGVELHQPEYASDSDSRADGRRFGEIPGFPEGSHFESRQALKAAGLHTQTQAGISGSKKDGADAIVLSGGYEDDHDEGSVVVYTGQGGRDPNTGQQVADQRMERGNFWLVVSQLRGLPVRVIRGADHRSLHAPAHGYRYDGLYRIEDHWSEVGRAGYRVWRYRLSKLEPTEAGTVQAESPTARREVTVSRIVRSSQRAQRVKQMHEYACQVCGERLETPSGPYAEAAHIRPLGLPHNGPDVESNILCLCPNHHVLFDFGALTIEDDLQIGGYPGRLRTHPLHQINLEHVRYHREHYSASDE